MSNVSFVDHLMSVLTFNKEGMSEIANDEGATAPAFLVALVGSVIGFISGLLAFMALDRSDYISDAFYELAQTLFMTTAVTALFFSILILFLFSGIMAFVLRGFGGTATTIQCVRVFGFTQIWSVIGAIINLVLNLAAVNLGFDLSFILGLVGLAAFILGLTTFSGLSLGSAIFAAIIAYILAFIVVFIVIFIIAIFLVAMLIAAL